MYFKTKSRTLFLKLGFIELCCMLAAVIRFGIDAP